MKVLQLGSFAILLKWVLLGIAFLIGIVFIKVWLNKLQKGNIGEKLFDLYFNSLFILLVAWKGSLVFLDPLLVLKSPLSLLYFTGGNIGLVIAVLITILYFLYKGRKITTQRVIMISLLLFSFMVTTIYHFLFLFFLEEHELFHLILGSISAILLYFAIAWDRKFVS